MYIDFSDIFHASSKDLNDKGAVNIPQDSSLWPPEWSTTYYKTYPRFPKIDLPREEIKADYGELIMKRRSQRKYSGRPIDTKKLSQLLLYSCGIPDPDSKNATRANPSGGARYPIEVYPIIFVGTDDLPAGLYHYNIHEHALDVLWKRDFNAEDIGKLFAYSWIKDASCALIMTAVFFRNQMKYGERGYRYILLEAGHISENIYLAAEALEVKCCAMGGMFDKNIEKLLDVDGATESVVHSVIIG